MSEEVEHIACSLALLSRQPEPRIIDICLVILLEAHLPVGDSERPIVRQPKELFQPLYVGDDLFRVHKVTSLLPY